MLYYQNRDIAKAVKNIVDTFLMTEIQLAERIKDTFFFVQKGIFPYLYANL